VISPSSECYAAVSQYMQRHVRLSLICVSCSQMVIFFTNLIFRLHSHKNAAYEICHRTARTTIQWNKSNFLWSAKTQYKKNAQKTVAATYSIIMINESNKRKTQRRLQRTAVSVITHAAYAIVLRTNFNATYLMHKIQRTHATQETTSHNPDTGDSDQ